MTEVILFLDGSKSCSCLLTSLAKRWVSDVDTLNLDDQFVLQTANYDRQAALILLIIPLGRAVNLLVLSFLSINSANSLVRRGFQETAFYQLQMLEMILD